MGSGEFLGDVLLITFDGEVYRLANVETRRASLADLWTTQS